MKTTISRLRPLLAVGVLAGALTACDSVMSAINIFLVKFFYGGGGVGSLILPNDLRAAANTYAACKNGSVSTCTSGALSLGLTSTTVTSLMSGNYSALTSQFTDKSKYGINLAFGLGADNSGNSDKAAFPLSTGINLFMSAKNDQNKMTTQLNPFEVAGGKVDTIPVTIPITGSMIPNAAFKSALKGNAIPYWLTGTLGFQLKSPTGDVLSSHETEMDLTTDSISTRPSDETVQTFLTEVSKSI